jgi:TonB family protein
MKFVSSTLLFLFALCLSARSSDTLAYYVNSSLKQEKAEIAHYYLNAIRTNEGWDVTTYYPIGKELHSRGRYLDDSFKKGDGFFNYYHANGQLQATGRYMQGSKTGLWLAYSSDGKLVDSTDYKENGKARYRYQWYENGAPAIITENGEDNSEKVTYLYRNGQVQCICKFAAGHIKDSIWTHYYRNGEISSRRVFRNDSLLSQKCFYETGKKKKCILSLNAFNEGTFQNRYINDSGEVIHRYTEEMPVPSVNINDLLANNIMYPVRARNANIEGKVYVSFIVDEHGEMVDVRQLGNKTIGGGLDEEAVRVISAIPPWFPGRQNDIPVKVYFTFPVFFKLK